MALCIGLDLSTGAIAGVVPQPTDLTTCQAVVLTPAEFSSASQIPDPAEAAEFFTFGFGMVVASYLAGWAVGVIRKTVQDSAR